jgi:hypothetical protein
VKHFSRQLIPATSVVVSILNTLFIESFLSKWTRKKLTTPMCKKGYFFKNSRYKEKVDL